MDRFLGKFSDQLLGALRVMAGLMFACHGGQKLLGMFGGMGGSGATADFLSQMWFAGVIELVGGFMIALGIGTTYAAFLCSGLMAAAYFMAHFPKGFFPIVNRGELAAVYCFLFLYLAARGPGAFSVDSLLKKNG